MRVSPQTEELRKMFDAAGIEYDADDYEDEDEYGTTFHSERTVTDVGFALHAWSKDADGRKKFESDGGMFADYIEVDIGDARRILDVEEAFEALIGGQS